MEIQELIMPKDLENLQLPDPGLLDYYQLAKNYAMVKVIVGKNFVPKTLVELSVRDKFDVNIVGVIRND